MLFEWFARAEGEDDEALEATFVDKAEQLVLWSLHGQLEKELSRRSERTMTGFSELPEMLYAAG